VRWKPLFAGIARHTEDQHDTSPRSPPGQLQTWHVLARDWLQAEFMLVASQEEALRSRRAKCPRSEQSHVTLEGGLRAYEVSHLLNLLRRHPPVCTNLLTTDCVGTESGTGHSQAFPTIIYSYVKVVTETESYGDGGVATGAGGGYH